MFEAAARLRNVTKAAHELCCTPAAVSKQLKNLEEFLQTELFIRSKQGVELTIEGERYLDKVTLSLTILSEETQRLRQRSAAPILDIEVGPCFLHFWLLPRLDKFRQAYPETQLNFVVSNDRDIGRNEEYDVAFFYSEIQTESRMSHLVFHERILLVCSPSFLHKQGGAVDIQNLFDYPLILLKEELPSWEGWRSWSKRMGLTYRQPTNALFVEAQIAVIQAALNHAGIALAWDWQVQDLLERGELIALTSALDFPDKAYFLTTSSTCDHAGAQTFIDWVISEAQI